MIMRNPIKGRRLGLKSFPESWNLTKDDYVIICGDFGLWDELEMHEGIQTLEAAGWETDYILTHCCATSLQNEISSGYDSDPLTDYFNVPFEDIREIDEE